MVGFALTDDPGTAADELAIEIKKMGDLERLISKVATVRICPREVVQLKRALNAIVPIVEACSASENKSIVKLASQLNPCDAIREKIAEQLQDDAPVQLMKGNVISSTPTSHWTWALLQKSYKCSCRMYHPFSARKPVRLRNA